MSGFVSTTDNSPPVGFKQAVLSNVPVQGGLYIPQSLEMLSSSDLKRISGSSFPMTAQIVLKHILGNEIDSNTLSEICNKAFCFDVPLKLLNPTVGALELFHGPTMAFKDVGVRFLAEVLELFSPTEERTILTATSGDTGAAVAGAFFKRPNTRVIVIYPKGKISHVQEQQIAGLGQNVQAFAVTGSFDDCQRMVNEVFANKKLVNSLRLTSANSINLARLLPQVSYYAYAWAQAKSITKLPLLFAVPSGNFGNISAGLIAKKIGIPIDFLLAATNDNDVVPRYLAGGDFTYRPAKETITTAMDIAVPNNFPRIESLFGPGSKAIGKSLLSMSVTVEETKSAMKQLYEKYQYISDPHGALAYFAASKVLPEENVFRIFLETAHPVKFREIVQEVLNIVPKTPLHAEETLSRKIYSKELSCSTEDLIKEFS